MDSIDAVFNEYIKPDKQYARSNKDRGQNGSGRTAMPPQRFRISSGTLSQVATLFKHRNYLTPLSMHIIMLINK